MIRFIYLGNIKWGFSDGLRPLPVEKVQSKWDFEHELKSRGNMGSSTKLDEFVPTSKVVSWPKVSIASKSTPSCIVPPTTTYSSMPDISPRHLAFEKKNSIQDSLSCPTHL